MVDGAEEAVAEVESTAASWWSETHGKREDRIERSRAQRCSRGAPPPTDRGGHRTRKRQCAEREKARTKESSTRTTNREQKAVQ